MHGEVVSHVNISRVEVQDGGLYQCTASNRAGIASHSARLNIYGKIASSSSSSDADAAACWPQIEITFVQQDFARKKLRTGYRKYVVEEYSIENEKNRNKDNMHYYFFQSKANRNISIVL